MISKLHACYDIKARCLSLSKKNCKPACYIRTKCMLHYRHYMRNTCVMISALHVCHDIYTTCLLRFQNDTHVTISEPYKDIRTMLQEQTWNSEHQNFLFKYQYNDSFRPVSFYNKKLCQYNRMIFV